MVNVNISEKRLIIGIITLAAIEIIALFKNIDGLLFILTSNLIVGLATYSISKK
jgi:hypothetical protein